MRPCTRSSCVAILAMFLHGSLQAGVPRWPLSSPDGRLVITVTHQSDGGLSYTVELDKRLVMVDSSLGLRRHDGPYDSGLRFVEAGKVETRRETYDLFAGGSAHVDHALNRRTLAFGSARGDQLLLDLAASNEGVAFRYRFPESNTNVSIVQAELTGFRFPAGTKGWLQPYHAATDYTPAYEDFYFHVSPGDAPPRSRGKPIGWCLPALFHVADAETWVLLAESGTDGSYCGCHLDAESSGGIYKIAFPAANEVTKRQTNSVGPEPRSTLPWTMPWRVLVIGNKATEIADSTLVTDLAPPSRMKDTSWIKPGRASWAWWAYPDGPTTAELFNSYTEFAAEMTWEYTLFDAGWWKPGLPSIAKFALSKGVAPLAWMFAGDFYNPGKRAQKLDEVAAAGARGVKVDFWCSDRQEAIAAIHALFEEAAARRMVVNLHGCTVPRGWERTWPNFLTCEAVLGTESYFYESQYTEKAAELNTVLPFTRNVVGPMDSTPVACSPKKYQRKTTAAHELATTIVLKSGLIHYADKPEFFRSLPAEALGVLRDAPARWDETRCLMGEPGRLAVFARRLGRTWFVAGLNGTGERSRVNLDLSAFKGFSKRTAITEGTDEVMQVSATQLGEEARWHHEMPPRGGFILRLDQ